MTKGNTTRARSPAKRSTGKETTKETTGALSCSCTSVQSASKAFYMQSGSKKESGSWNGASGTDCTCGGKKYKAINISFPEAMPRDVPALPMPTIGAASVLRPFAMARPRLAEIMDDLDRDFMF